MLQKSAKILPKNILKRNLFYLIVRICLQHFLHECLKKYIFIPYLVQTPRNLKFLEMLVFEKSHLLLKLISDLEQLSCDKKLNLMFFENHYFAIQPELEIWFQTRFQMQHGNICKEILLFLLPNDHFWSFKEVKN